MLESWRILTGAANSTSEVSTQYLYNLRRKIDVKYLFSSQYCLPNMRNDFGHMRPVMQNICVRQDRAGQVALGVLRNGSVC